MKRSCLAPKANEPLRSPPTHPLMLMNGILHKQSWRNDEADQTPFRAIMCDCPSLEIDDTEIATKHLPITDGMARKNVLFVCLTASNTVRDGRSLMEIESTIKKAKQNGWICVVACTRYSYFYALAHSWESVDLVISRTVRDRQYPKPKDEPQMLVVDDFASDAAKAHRAIMRMARA